jgi:hypothetical protein
MTAHTAPFANAHTTFPVGSLVRMALACALVAGLGALALQDLADRAAALSHSTTAQAMTPDASAALVDINTLPQELSAAY